MTSKRIASIAALALLTVGVAVAQERFDMIVRQDFFAGFGGNKQAFERAMKVTEDTLAKDPNHAEARVWHGTGVFFLSAEALQKGDQPNGLKLWQQGLDEMERAVRQAPDNVGVLVPRGATLITATRFFPPEVGKPVLETGVSDFEKVLKLQEPRFSQLGVHPRGELLTGLADGWSRLGNNDKAREYFERIATELEGSVYERKARAWLENKPEAKSPGFFSCSGCHVK
jgi:hypothetical protein